MLFNKYKKSPFSTFANINKNISNSEKSQMKTADRRFWNQVREGRQFLVKVQAGGERQALQQTGKERTFLNKDEIECWIYDKSR